MKFNFNTCALNIINRKDAIKRASEIYCTQQQHKSRKRSRKELNMVNAKKEMSVGSYLYLCNLNASNTIRKKNENMFALKKKQTMLNNRFGWRISEKAMVCIEQKRMRNLSKKSHCYKNKNKTFEHKIWVQN